MYDKEKLYQRAIQTYGKENQMNMLIEECAELIQAVNKMKRNPNSLQTFDNLAEEVADVTIMLEQLFMIYQKHNLKFVAKEWKEQKLKRLQRRLNESEVE